MRSFWLASRDPESPELRHSFGLYWNGVGGFLSAEHCRWLPNGTTFGGWTVNGHSVNTRYDSKLQGYQDRAILHTSGEAPTYWTWDGLNWQDMAGSAGHIMQGVYYCQTSKWHYGQSCSTITAVNQAVSAPNGQTLFTSRTGTSLCGPGDSGGPVWQPQSSSPSLPSGTVEVKYAGGNCGYMSLDDQLSGTGWSLL